MKIGELSHHAAVCRLVPESPPTLSTPRTLGPAMAPAGNSENTPFLHHSAPSLYPALGSA